MNPISARSHIEATMPRTFFLLEKGQKSRFLHILESVFHLHTNLQFHCLPITCRNLGVRLYLDELRHKSEASVHNLWDDWVKKEEEAVNSAVENKKLSEEQQILITTVRETVFQLVHEEQEDLKQENPYHPFISIFNERGTRNLDYANEALELGKAYVASTQEQMSRLETHFKQFLSLKDVQYDSLTAEQQLLAQKAKKAAYDALLKSVNEGSCTFHDEQVFLMSLVASDDKPEYFQSLEATNIAEKKWKYYSERWERVFESRYGYSLKSLSAEQQEFLFSMRAVFFRLIHEEQAKHGLPFVSICTSEGAMNSNYSLDILEAKAKKAKEKPFSEPKPLAEFTDFDVVCLENAPPLSKGPDETGLRAAEGSATKDFCNQVLLTLAKRVYKSSFERLPFSEQLLFIQNQFCQSLAATHYVRGMTTILLDKINVDYSLTEPQLLSMASPRNKVENHPLLEECDVLRNELATLHERKLPTGKTLNPDDALCLQFADYSRLIGLMSSELSTLSEVLELFAKKLERESLGAVAPYRASSQGSCPPASFAGETARMPPMRRSYSATHRRLQTPSPEIETPPNVHGMSYKKFGDISQLIGSTASLFKEIADLLSHDPQAFEPLTNLRVE